MLVLVVALSALLLPAAAATQPYDGGSSPEPGPASGDEVNAEALGWSDEQLQSLAQSTKSTIEQARERVEADVHYEQLISEARHRYPETFGGYEIEPYGPTGLTLFFTRDVGASLAAVSEAAPAAIRVSAAMAKHSSRRLQDLYDKALERNNELIDRESGEEFSSLRLDLANNRVVLAVDTNKASKPERPSELGEQDTGVSPPLRAPRADESEWEGLEIVAETVTAVPDACVNRDDCNSMRGGTAITYNNGVGRCTMSYTGYDKSTGAALSLLMHTADAGFLTTTKVRVAISAGAIVE